MGHEGLLSLATVMNYIVQSRRESSQGDEVAQGDGREMR